MQVLRKNTETLSQDSRCPCQDGNIAVHKSEAIARAVGSVRNKQTDRKSDRHDTNWKFSNVFETHARNDVI
jgi:hypothetical protein